MAFDLTGVPTGATVTAASLDLTVSRAGTDPAANSMSLHKVNADWGEGTSTGGGQGTPATTGDATWLRRFFDTSSWANSGGDFVQTVSATATVRGAGDAPRWSSAGLVADVQSWVASPSGNFGWILVGDETTPRTVKRFNSKDRGSNPPQLTVTYSDAPASISLTIAADDVAEGAGPGATRGTVTRTGDTSSALVVNLNSNDTTEVTVPVSVTIDAGQATSPFFDLDAVDDSIVDGTQTVTLTASAAGFSDATDNVNVLDDDVATLTLTIVADSISEGAGPAATTATVTRNTDTAGALVVNVASSDAGEATVPAMVTILAGETTSTPFNVNAVDDAVVDGTQSIVVTASAPGFVDGTDNLDVTDDDVPTLTLIIAADSISEGDGAAATTATVVRNTDATNPLVVNLASSDTSEATVPATVTIAAGQMTSPAFNIAAVNDALADGTQTVTVTASATGLASGTDTVDVLDDDTGALTLTIAADSFSEAAGAAATTATVSRNTDTTDALVVNLASDDTGEATVPATVTIAAGQTTSPAFPIDAVDDGLVDGSQTVTVKASATGLTDGTDTVVVTDDDIATLTLTIAADAISENAGAAATTATVSRNTATTGALVVNLASSDTSEATVPATVTIAAGQATSQPFDIDAVDDSILDGTQTVDLTASAAGFTSGTDSLDVTDNEVPTLTLTIAAKSFSEGAGQAATTATVTRLGDTTDALVVSLLSSDTSEAELPVSVTIAAGETTSPAISIDAVDDSIVDGTQTVTMRARAAGFVDGTETLDVTDDDLATLTLDVAADSISEAAGAGAATATVTRNTDTSGALVVDLASNDTSEAAVPASVTIPAGSASVMFAVDAVNDVIDDETQKVTITGSAAGFINGTDAVDVTDDDITLTIKPLRDNTLYEDETGALSNGAGDFLFSGTNNRGERRRAAVAFDLAAAGIPSSANIGMVDLQMTVSRSSSENNEDVALHRLAVDWGEGASNAPGSEGNGAPAETGDATWLHNFFNTFQWANPGGDFEPTASATTSVGTADSMATWTSAGMVADVAAWLAAPAANFGWVLVGNETANGTAKRFDSKDNANGSPPSLAIVYSLPPQFLSVSIDAEGISESNGATTATVTRTQTDGPLTVDLVSSDPSEATIIASVTIPDGQATSDPVAITAANDDLLDGTQPVTMTATAPGYEPGRDVLNVFDDETTWVQVAAGNLLIEDAAGGQTDDQLTIATDGSELIVRDPQNSITTDIAGASGQGTNELRVPLAAFSGQLSIDTKGGNNSVSLAGSVDGPLAARMSFMAGTGENSLVLLGEGIALNLSQVTNFDRIDITGTGDNSLNVALAAALNNVDDAADSLTLLSDLGDSLTFDAGWSIPDTFVADGTFFRVVRQGDAMLHVAGPSDWQNPALALDVSGDSAVVSRDALLIINELNQPTFTTGVGRLMEAAGLDPFPLFFFDVLATGFATPSGAARIIDFLNSQISQEGEGETGNFIASRSAPPHDPGAEEEDRRRFSLHDGLFASAYRTTGDRAISAAYAAGTRPDQKFGVGRLNESEDLRTAGEQPVEVDTNGATRRPALRPGSHGDLTAPLDFVPDDVLQEIVREVDLNLSVIDQTLDQISR